MFFDVDERINFQTLELELQELFKVPPGSQTWYLTSSQIIFIDEKLSEEHEAHEFKDPDTGKLYLSPVSLLIRKHKTVPSQLAIIRKMKLDRIDARVKNIIKKRYNQRSEIEMIRKGIISNKDLLFKKYEKFIKGVYEEAEKVKKEFMKLPHKTRKDLVALKEYVVPFTHDTFKDL